MAEIVATMENNTTKKLMSNKKHTAIEWLVNEISKSGIGLHTMIVHKKEIEQAKEMEKQQIIDAVDETISEMSIYESSMIYENGEQYYKETYGK